MIFFDKKSILKKAHLYLEQGLFFQGHKYLRRYIFLFFILSGSTFTKNEYHFLIGAFLNRLGDHKKAIIHLKKSILSPQLDRSESLYYLINSYLQLKDNQRIIYYYKKLLGYNYNFFLIILSSYELIRNKIDLDIKIESLKELIQDEEGSLDYNLSLSIILILEEKYLKALEILEEAVKKHSKKYFVNHIYLKVLYFLMDYERMIEHFDNNMNYLSSRDLLYIYSLILYKIGLWDQCLQVIDILLSLEKSHVKSMINVSKVFMQKHKYTLAIKTLKSSFWRTNDQNEKDCINFLISIAYQRTGLLNDSIRYILRISKNSEYYSNAMFNISLLYYDLGNYRSSLEAFEIVDKIKINDKKYDKWQNRILKLKTNIPSDAGIRRIIYILPWAVVIFSIIIFTLFYFIYK